MIQSIQLLGWSAGQPTSERNLSAAVIQIRESHILVDCGEGTYQRWLQSGHQFHHLSTILITHLHPDHLGGLVPLLFYRYLHRIDRPLTLVGPPQLEDFLNSSFQFMGINLKHAPEILSVHQFEHAGELENIRVTTRLLEHKIPCWGYRLEGKSQVVTYITDTRPCQGGRELAARADVLIHEATFPAEKAAQAYENFHTTIDQALELAQDAGVRRLLLTHFTPELADRFLHTLTYRGQSCFVDSRKMSWEELVLGTNQGVKGQD